MTAAAPPFPPLLAASVRAWTAGLLAAAGLAGLLAARFAAVPADRPAPPPSAYALAFADLFDRAEVGPIWSGVGLVQHGARWSIHDDALCFRGNSDGFLLLSRTIFGDYRIEFDLAACADSTYLGDLSLLVQVSESEAKIYWGDSYVFTLGAEGNSRTRIFAHPGETPLVSLNVSRGGPLLVAGQVFHVTIERTRRRLRFLVDRTPILEYDEYFPPPGAGYSTFTFSTHRGHVHFDNLLIYSLVPPAPPGPLDEAERKYRLRDRAGALELYRAAADRLAAESSGAAQQAEAEARFKLALLQIGQGRHAEAAANLERVADPAGRAAGTEWSARARFYRARLRAWLGEWEAAAPEFDAIAASDPGLHLALLCPQSFGALAPHLAETGRLDGARAYYRRAAASANGIPALATASRTAAADLLAAQGQAADAIGELSALVREAPGPAPEIGSALAVLTCLLGRQGRLAELPPLCAELNRRAAGDAGLALAAATARAAALIGLGRLPEAEAEVATALTQHANSARVLRFAALEMGARAARLAGKPLDLQETMARLGPAPAAVTLDVVHATWRLVRTAGRLAMLERSGMPDPTDFPEVAWADWEQGRKEDALSGWRSAEVRPRSFQRAIARLLLAAAGGRAGATAGVAGTEPAPTFEALVAEAAAARVAYAGSDAANDLEFFIGVAHLLAGRKADARAAFVRARDQSVAAEWPYFEAEAQLARMDQEGK
ncbi:MAG: hypothetical protein HZA54_01030 [Planctomycetes bacterium]|nr:hypothetical protein [Planctomycetota bacterium]